MARPLEKLQRWFLDESFAPRSDDVGQWQAPERSQDLVVHGCHVSARTEAHTFQSCNLLRGASNPHVFSEAGGRKKSQSSVRGQGNSLSMGRACVYIYCTLRGLGHTPPCCCTLGTSASLHPDPIKEHKELFDSLYKSNMTNKRIVYCLIPMALHSTLPPRHWRLCVMSVLRKQWFVLTIASEMWIARLLRGWDAANARRAWALWELERGTGFIWWFWGERF